MSENAKNCAPDRERLAALIFEIASQLHVERTRRIALETQLRRLTVLSPEWDQGLDEDNEVQRISESSLERSMQEIMRILCEEDDLHSPCRYETNMPFRRDDT